MRSAEKCLRFYVVQVGEEQIQVVCQVTEVDDIEAYKCQHEHLARGDIIGITGHPGRTSLRRRPVGEFSTLSPHATKGHRLHRQGATIPQPPTRPHHEPLLPFCNTSPTRHKHIHPLFPQRAWLHRRQDPNLVATSWRSISSPVYNIPQQSQAVKLSPHRTRVVSQATYYWWVPPRLRDWQGIP
jgi:hypothetical protein